ncbi:TRAP-type C4-dicarboxylate transport system substrate-binding protein [Palleronia aestuarii]|uniref:TRAP-type C4-dicarboxylate transport system substrate-binding protein n=1 Tax=Palleronia aestuarii TaxID=568105 RepID=A0A2W7NAD3_9RHOB|nr:TRAP transporter substrate-binding protein [Palleronia aestuarii]PZX17038.1 TRAP-type C4-dicarboxylate transport system substrate-binding protein [Palleronia aestuarii]
MAHDPVRRALIGTGLGLLVAGSAAAQEYSFTLHHFLGPQSATHTETIMPWAERVEAASEGRISIEIYPSMTLGGTPPELIRQVRDGVVDMVWTLNGYTPGLFPRTEVFELPSVYRNDPAAANLAMAELFDTYLAEEHVGVEVLFQHVHAGQAIVMRDREVRAPADLEGATLRIPTRTGAWMLEALDANPVSMPVPDLPQALSRGVVDGALIPFEIIPALQLQDLTEYDIELADGVRFGTSVFQLSMNLDRWSALPEDIQQIFLDQSDDDWLRELGGIWEETEREGLRVATEAGSTHVMLGSDESAAFDAPMQTVVDRWIAEAEADGRAGAELVEAARRAIADNAE